MEPRLSEFITYGGPLGPFLSTGYLDTRDAARLKAVNKETRAAMMQSEVRLPAFQRPPRVFIFRRRYRDSPKGPFDAARESARLTQKYSYIPGIQFEYDGRTYLTVTVPVGDGPYHIYHTFWEQHEGTRFKSMEVHPETFDPRLGIDVVDLVSHDGSPLYVPAFVERGDDEMEALRGGLTGGLIGGARLYSKKPRRSPRRRRSRIRK